MALHAGRLPSNPALPGDGFRAGHDTAGEEATPAFIFARKEEGCVAFCDSLAAIHRLLSNERKRFCPRITNGGLDRER